MVVAIQPLSAAYGTPAPNSPSSTRCREDASPKLSPITWHTTPIAQTHRVLLTWAAQVTTPASPRRADALCPWPSRASAEGVSFRPVTADLLFACATRRPGRPRPRTARRRARALDRPHRAAGSRWMAGPGSPRISSCKTRPTPSRHRTETSREPSVGANGDKFAIGRGLTVRFRAPCRPRHPQRYTKRDRHSHGLLLRARRRNEDSGAESL